jgi:hypothetical protein
MKKIRDTLVILAALAVIGNVLVSQKVLAQNPALTPQVFTVTGVCKGNFVASPTGSASYCFGSDVAEYSINGGAITQFVPPTAAAALTGITKNGVAVPVTNGVAALTISATSSSTATAPAASFASNGALTLSAPGVTTTTTVQ